MKVIGGYVSPYVRKVLACLHLKGLDYEIDPITPFYGDAEFERVSPLRRIPVLIDGDVELCDSSVICAYLDEAYPGHPLLPQAPADRARARWLEEYADTRMGDVFIWRLFQNAVIKPAVWGEKGDKAVIATALETDIPGVLDYLEAQVPAEGYLFGELLGLADISLGVFFRNAAFARFSIDAGRWPKTAAFVGRVLGHPALRMLQPYEDVCMTTPIAGHRDALRDKGAPITAETVATATPQKGVMPI
jgi:glutathione S-transferase